MGALSRFRARPLITFLPSILRAVINVRPDCGGGRGYIDAPTGWLRNGCTRGCLADSPTLPPTCVGGPWVLVGLVPLHTPAAWRDRASLLY